MRDLNVASSPTQLYFSDIFGLPPAVVKSYGALDVSLTNDLPLFIDPFLLFHSSKPEYQALHRDIIGYVEFLRDKAVAGHLDDRRLGQWFMFREVKQTWLGYSRVGNQGSGLGRDFAKAMSDSLSKIFANFGSEDVSQGSHLERLCLIGEGVGRDNISDLTTNLIKPYLLQYTQGFARLHLKPEHRRVVPVSKARFDLHTEAWTTERFELPFVNGDYVLLTPYDMLTKDEMWINRVDLVRDYSEIAHAVPDKQLRTQLDIYFQKILWDIRQRDEVERSRHQSGQSGRQRAADEPTKKQLREAASRTIEAHPEVIDHFIRYKEDHGDEGEAQASERVRSSEALYIAQVRQLAGFLFRDTDFYGIRGNTAEEARARVDYLKDIIENKGGYRLFYVKDEPVRRESDLQLMFRLTWINTPSDVNREVNNGRGPSDFEVSRGRFDKTIIEFKLASNPKLEHNLQYQAETYQKASDAGHALKVIVYFTADERKRAMSILGDLGIERDPNVILIDARADNKPSGSRVTGVST